MNKLELLKNVAEACTEKVTQKQVAAVLAALESVVKDTVLAGDEVTIPGICKVAPKIVKERSGVIRMGARKGESYVKPEHKEATVRIVPAFKKIFE